ncbi:MAG: DNA repair protein RadC [Candidatus Hydrogenedentota bacterium]
MKPPKPFIDTAVREMPEEERPRERLEHTGAESLRDAELLAILFRTGTRTMGAVALAEALLRHFGGLRQVARASIDELQQVKGIGKVKAIEIKSALELGKRLANFTETTRPRIRSAQDVADLLMVRYKEYETEVFKCILVNTKNDVLKTLDISSGGLDGTMADPKDVFRQAVREGATGIILCHNHPSGDPEPSLDDIAVTERLQEAGEVLGVRVLDHVIFGDGAYISLKERKLM